MAFKLTDSDIYSCGQDVETVEHVLLHCKLFSCKRDKFRKEFEQLSVSWPPVLSSLVNCIGCTDVFKNFVYCLKI